MNYKELLETLKEDQEASIPYFTIDGATYYRKIKGGEAVCQKLANFTAKVTSELLVDDGAEVTRYLTLSGQHETSGPLPEVRIKADEFTGMNWVVKYWGAACAITSGNGNRDRFREAVQLLSGTPPTQTIFAHLGWRQIDNNWVYLHSGGAVGASGIACDPGSALARYRLPERVEDPKAALQAVLALAQVVKPEVLWPLLGAVFKSVLESFAPTPGSLWLVGPSGVGKSTLSALVLNLFGGPFDGATLPASWLATENALELLAFRCKDAVLVVDDYSPERDKNRAADLERKVARLLRQVGNRQARGRLRSDLSPAPDRPPRCLLISSGEQLPPAVQSILARVLCVKVEPGDLKFDAIQKYRQRCIELLPQATVVYLTWLRDKLPTIQNSVNGFLDVARDEFNSTSAHPRLVDIGAHMLLGAHMFIKLAEHYNAITAGEAAEYRQTATAILVNLIGQQAKIVKEEDFAGRFLMALIELFQQKRVHVTRKNGLEPKEPQAWGWIPGEYTNINGYVSLGGFKPGGVHVGYLDDDGALLLMPQTAYAEVAKFLREIGATIPAERTLRDALARAQVIEAPNGESTLPVRINGQLVRVLKIKPGVLQRYAEIYAADA